MGAYENMRDRNQPLEQIAKLTLSDTLDITSSGIGLDDVRRILPGATGIVNVLPVDVSTPVALPLTGGMFHDIRARRVYTTGTDSMEVWGGF